MTTHKRILIIGGGPAGMQAALAAAAAGCRVTIVSDSMPGGRAAWQTQLPSKILLGAKPGDSLEMLRARYERVAGAWQRKLLNDLERSGVELRLGVGSFVSPHEIEVRPPEGGYADSLGAEAIIVATGSVPYVPPNLQTDGERVFGPHMIWRMPKLPESMVVIGAGGPATEYVDAFSRLGVQITWITGPVGLLSAFPPDAGQLIAKVMARRGVKIITGLMAREITPTANGVQVQTADNASHAAEMAFVAIGLRPDLSRLNLAAAGLKAGSSGGLAVDAYGRTAVPHIFLAGDAASPLSANISLAQGRVAGTVAAGLTAQPVNPDDAVMAIYTNPQVAVVGRMVFRAGQMQKVRVPFMSSLRAHLLMNETGCALPGVSALTEDETGFLEIAYDGVGRVTGALAVCPEAAEILAPLAVAIRAGMTMEDLATLYPASPTFSELAVLAARAVVNQSGGFGG